MYTSSNHPTYGDLLNTLDQWETSNANGYSVVHYHTILLFTTYILYFILLSSSFFFVLLSFYTALLSVYLPCHYISPSLFSSIQFSKYFLSVSFYSFPFLSFLPVVYSFVYSLLPYLLLILWNLSLAHHYHTFSKFYYLFSAYFLFCSLLHFCFNLL